ncbi:type II secretion system protein N [Ramlibacter tataouinensis]|uniref:Type II secretion system protein N n=1 Tax=Ramlibacter tataouinensis (strain ATCC BAA-407 / DSM 14655 / LMG 21543 / TTB310) TaxID=365046 RepID=F5Y0Q9_RAMTT|nr:type II secretion system protein N [Ramlibacter tataouinensis]AEG94653.1 candidate general secretion pathway protein C, component of type II secretion system [Ramlibacter tataouinensis TTB310]
MARRLSTASALQTRPAWGWAAAGAVLGLLAALVFFIPASWAAAALSGATAGRLLLDEPRGTVWNGSARLVLTGGAGSRDAAALPSRLQWRLRPAATGMRLEVEAPCCTTQPLALRIQPRWGGAAVAAADGASRWPAALLAGLGTPWNTLQLDGELQLATRGLSVEWTAGRLQVQGQAELQAVNLSSRLTTLRPMGSYRIVLAGGATPTLQVSTLEGPLQLAGSGQWIGSRLRFTGQASAEPEREAALGNLLNIIGRREGARSIITIG